MKNVWDQWTELSQLFDRWIASSWHSYRKLISEDNGINGSPILQSFFQLNFFSLEMLWQFISVTPENDWDQDDASLFSRSDPTTNEPFLSLAPAAFHHRTIASHCLTMTVTKYGLVMLLAPHITSPTLARREISNRYQEPFTVTSVTPLAVNWRRKCECHITRRCSSMERLYFYLWQAILLPIVGMQQREMPLRKIDIKNEELETENKIIRKVGHALGLRCKCTLRTLFFIVLCQQAFRDQAL